MAPLTIAVALGPLIDIAQFAVASGAGASRLSQVTRGALLTLMAASVTSKVRSLRESSLAVPLLALGVYGSFWTAVRGDAYEAMVFGVRTCFLALTYLCALDFAARGLIGARWLGGVAWAVLVTVVSSQVVGRVLHVSAYERAFDFPGLTGEPSLIAASVCAVFPFFFVRTPLQPGDVFAAAIAAVSIVATQRRSALIAVLFAIAIFGAHVFLSRSTRSGFRSAGAVVAAVGVACAVAAWTPLGGELAGRFADLDFAKGGTGSGRMVFQRIAVDRIIDRGAADTLFGEGLGRIRDLLADYFGAAIGAHNDWIDIVFGLGILGGAMFLALHVGLVALVLRMHGASRISAMMALGSFVVIEFTAGGTLDPSFAPTFALLGSLAGHDRLARFRAGHATGPGVVPVPADERGRGMAEVTGRARPHARPPGAPSR